MAYRGPWSVLPAIYGVQDDEDEDATPEVLRMLIGNIDANLPHDRDGLGADAAARIRARGPGPPARRRQAVEQAFGYLRAGGIVRSDKEHEAHHDPSTVTA